MSELKTQDNLVKMANQISGFFDSQTPTEPATAAQAVAAHLKLYWAPPMRARLVGQVERGETEGVAPVVLTAVRNHRDTLLNENAHVPGEAALFGPKGGGDAG